MEDLIQYRVYYKIYQDKTGNDYRSNPFNDLASAIRERDRMLPEFFYTDIRIVREVIHREQVEPAIMQ